jgi:protein MpaA
VKRLGLNRQWYRGETIEISSIIEQLKNHARNYGWTEYSAPIGVDLSLPFFTRIQPGNLNRRRLYLSAGIHGDEPAGPLAMLTLLRENQWPTDADLWLCPCLNPTGFPLNSRENAQGIDLNRDYLDRRSTEVQAHLRWLETQPEFERAICLHEDWEADGFYCYELNLSGFPSSADKIIHAVSQVCPIEQASVIDGRESQAPGIIRPVVDPATRLEWPEAFFLLRHKTQMSYTLEAPSDYPLTTRVAALVEGANAALKATVS